MSLSHLLKMIYLVPTICQALFLGAEDSAVNKTQSPLSRGAYMLVEQYLLALLQ